MRADDVIELTGDEIGRGHRGRTVAGRFGIDTIGIGEDIGLTVVDTYKPPYKFTGKIERWSST